MSKVFNYNTLEVSFNRITASTTIAMKENSEAITSELIFEMETLFGWLCSHLEIRSIILKAESFNFGEGLNANTLESLDHKRFETLLKNFQKLIHGMFHLPQTLIVDFGRSATGASIELALPADIRIMNTQGSLVFDQLQRGLIPCSGGIGILSHLVGPSFARGWLMSSKRVKADELLYSGFITETYNYESREEKLLYILENIKNQGPVQSIQAKRAHLEYLLPELSRCLQFEKRIASAANISGDWKEAAIANIENRLANFSDPRSFAKALKAESPDDSLA